MSESDYDTDLVLWSARQAALLRERAAGRLVNDAEFDWLNIADEIESLGKSEQRELHSRVRTILDHLIRFAVSPATEPRAGWQATIIEQRDQLHLLLRDSPSLKGELAEVINKELPTARRLALLALAEHGEKPTTDPAALSFDVAKVIEDVTIHSPTEPG